MRQRRSFLGVKKNLGDIDWNVTEIELENGVSSGITVNMYSQDMIPPYYEHLARTQSKISLDRWAEMGRWEKALTIAIMFTSNAVQNQQSEAEINHAKANASRSTQE